MGSQVFFRGEEKKSDLLASTKIEQIIRQPRVLNQKMQEINHALYQLYKINHDQDQFAVLKIRPSSVNFTRDRKLTLSKKILDAERTSQQKERPPPPPSLSLSRMKNDQVPCMVRARSCREGGVRLLPDGGVPAGRGGALGAVRVGPLRRSLPPALVPLRRHGKPVSDLRDAYSAGTSSDPSDREAFVRGGDRK